MAAEDLGIDFYLNEPRPGARGQCFYSPSLKLLGEPSAHSHWEATILCVPVSTPHRDRARVWPVCTLSLGGQDQAQALLKPLPRLVPACSILPAGNITAHKYPEL